MRTYAGIVDCHDRGEPDLERRLRRRNLRIFIVCAVIAAIVLVGQYLLDP